ncbi:hypothetical protein VB776_22300 [Arcicella sp. DC2W]|uniref:Outer membrane protein beta-barrel domain-containing protein n=1 Tax=Arcicella gelida TaxID=2984195 RepID=A0ABU5SB16_9BACT|nr:hypothetical protein [Arcicella sp. DC2W]MEA5405687.1 hypothetical protein [Arcicella sp. DC2W]
MKKKLLTLLLTVYALSVNHTFAQENTTKQARFDTAPEPERRKWEVALDVFNFIGTFNGSNVNGVVDNQGYLIIRRYSMNKVKKSAIECKLGIANSNLNFIDTDNNEFNSVKNNYNIGFGYEFQKQQGRFMLFYGPRVRSLFTIDSSTPKLINITSSNGGTYNVRNSNGMLISGGVFLGGRFFFNSHLSISLSSNLEIFYDKSTYNTKVLNSLSNNLVQEANSSRGDVQINGGFSMVQIGYHF